MSAYYTAFVLPELEAFDPKRTLARAQIREDLAKRIEKRNQARRLGDVFATNDLELAAELETLGFDKDRACVVDLLPLIQVAWADGRIQKEERVRILRVLRARGLDRSDPAWEFVEALLEERPSDAYFEASLQVLARLLEKRSSTTETVVSMCVQVAEASGGLWGLRPAIDANERKALEQVAESLGERAMIALRQRLGGY